ncbi:MAG: RNA polymerase sigma factor [Planctomycetota bacterium]
MPDNRPDPELTGSVKQGNRNAFGDLVSRYQKPVYYFALGITANHHSAEEISHETWIKFWKSIGSGAFDQTQPVYPYLRTICLNLARDYLNDEKHRRQLTKNMVEMGGNFDCNGGSHNDKIINAETGEKITRAIESLEPQQRLVMTLKVIEGCSYQEISEQLNCPVGTVMSRLFRARMELRGKIKSEQ